MSQVTQITISTTSIQEESTSSPLTPKIPNFIDNFFNSLFSRQYSNDDIHINEIMKAFWNFRDLICDMNNAFNRDEIYDVLFEKLKIISEKSFVLSNKKAEEFDNFLEIFFEELLNDVNYDKYTYEDAYDLSEEPEQESWIFSSF